MEHHGWFEGRYTEYMVEEIGRYYTVSGFGIFMLLKELLLYDNRKIHVNVCEQMIWRITNMRCSEKVLWMDIVELYGGTSVLDSWDSLEKY